MKVDVCLWLQDESDWLDVFTIHNIHTNNLTINYLDQDWQSIWLLYGTVGKKMKKYDDYEKGDDYH